MRKRLAICSISLAAILVLVVTVLPMDPVVAQAQQSAIPKSYGPFKGTGLSPSGYPVLVFESADNTIRLVDVKSGQVVATYPRN